MRIVFQAFLSQFQPLAVCASSLLPSGRLYLFRETRPSFNLQFFKSLAFFCLHPLNWNPHIHLVFISSCLVTFILKFIYSHFIQLDCCSVCLTCQQIHLQPCLRPLFQGSSTARQTHRLCRTTENIFILPLFHFFPLSGNSLSLPLLSLD